MLLHRAEMGWVLFCTEEEGYLVLYCATVGNFLFFAVGHQIRSAGNLPQPPRQVSGRNSGYPRGGVSGETLRVRVPAACPPFPPRRRRAPGHWGWREREWDRERAGGRGRKGSQQHCHPVFLQQQQLTRSKGNSGLALACWLGADSGCRSLQWETTPSPSRPAVLFPPFPPPQSPRAPPR